MRFYFVFVMSVLEHFSDHDCSILLGYARRDIITLRTRAMQRLARSLGIKDDSRMDAEQETMIELVIAQHFAAAPWTRSLSQ